MTRDEIKALREMEKAATPGWKQALHIDEPRALVSAANPMVSLLGLDRDDMAIFDRAEDCALAVALRNAAPALLDAAERCARYEAVLYEEKTVAIGLAHALIMSLGEQVTEDAVEEIMGEARSNARAAIAALADGGGER